MPIVRENQHKAAKAWDAYNVFLLEVQQVRAQNKQTHQLTVSQLKTRVKWFHRNGDEPMPQKKNKLFVRYDAMKDRGERPPPPLAPQDDEEDDDNDDNDNGHSDAEAAVVVE